MSEIQVALAKVTDVEEVDGHGIFLEVELTHYSDQHGEALTARVRWCSPYHGPNGQGLWHYPDIGAHVLCIFPSPAPHGEPGGDLDEGFALAYAAFTAQPPVDGLAGDLSATRMVFKTRSGEALDVHLRGAVDRKVEGVETLETVGTLIWTLRAASEFLGDALVRVKSLATLYLFGTVKVEIESGTEILIKAPTITLDADTLIELGDGGGSLRLMTEAMMTLFNNHDHVFAVGVPTTTLVAGTHTTTITKAE